MSGRSKAKVVTARDEQGRRHTLPDNRPEPPTACEKCGGLNRVDYEGWHVGVDDETRDSYSEFLLRGLRRGERLGPAIIVGILGAA